MMGHRLHRDLVPLALAAGLLRLALLGCGGEPVTPQPEVVEEQPAAAYSAVLTGSAAAAVGGFPSVVAFELLTAASSASPPSSAPAVMDQLGTAFYPPTLLTRVGQVVQFHNSEAVMHNVNVATDGGRVTIFNVATPPGFEAYEHAFTEPGVYRVTCDIHPSMSAFIVAVATPYATVADTDGRFRLEGVPPGSYTASVWSLDASKQVRRQVEIPAGSVELDLRVEEPAG